MAMKAAGWFMAFALFGFILGITVVLCYYLPIISSSPRILDRIVMSRSEYDDYIYEDDEVRKQSRPEELSVQSTTSSAVQKVSKLTNKTTPQTTTTPKFPTCIVKIDAKNDDHLTNDKKEPMEITKKTISNSTYSTKIYEYWTKRVVKNETKIIPFGIDRGSLAKVNENLKISSTVENTSNERRNGEKNAYRQRPGSFRPGSKPQKNPIDETESKNVKKHVVEMFSTLMPSMSLIKLSSKLYNNKLYNNTE